MRRTLQGGLAIAAATVATIAMITPSMAVTDGSAAGIANPPSAAEQRVDQSWTLDYPDAEQHPADPSNYTAASRPDSNPINYVVIHVTQGSWEGSLSWFQNPDSDVSAHYTIRSSDGKVAQSVDEQDIAWHAGNWEYNQTSVGIEHEGWIDEPEWFTDAMYESSAKVTAHLVTTYGIPVDRDHIIGHVEVPGATHTDPGPHWDWDKYMALVEQFAAAS